MEINSLIKNADFVGLTELLSKQPELANKEIHLCEGGHAAHPLHRICDGVFNNLYSDEQAIEMAKTFLRFGARVNGNELVTKQDTPLIAAASLKAEKTGIFYIDSGANVHHQGCHGGTALHWAAWCGRESLVKRLLAENADIHKKCIDFAGTPLLWAVHGYKYGGEVNRHQQIECVRLLIDAGSDKTVTNIEGYALLEFIDETDAELRELLS